MCTELDIAKEEKRLVVHFNRLKLCPANVCSLSYCPKDASYSSAFRDATSSPVNTKDFWFRWEGSIDSDDDERVVDSSVSASEGISTTDHENTSVFETIENVLAAESTSVTGTAESVSTTENISY